jgi:spore germination cell wall hydrolase CwlJ-like protein
MFRSRISAAGAAALLFILSATFHAAPSRAWELSLPTVTTPVPAVAPDLPPAPTILPPAEAPAPAVEAAPRLQTLAALVAAHSSAAPRDAEEECLAGAVYFEAKGEPLKGQLSVAEVILNRTKSGRFPGSACGVVRQRGQFSFVRGGRFPPIARASAAWRKAVAIAHVAREDLAAGAARGALFFHAKRVSPGWRGLTRIAAVGNHVFYR